ncbi:Barstar (barnase inhibitor) [Streptomyces sp. YIM 130001]|uniref:barstar family protein n=1 Tax=Streptomyces sp. YIM 130001 TaxID=2259644 RepID=UPI000E65654B|nr:barstar family protein [Streptomyces sp. YIM 130001]RII19428.1 Barstar (barnase inhibitor) [Streptomyces sp. YIM 130001]
MTAAGEESAGPGEARRAYGVDRAAGAVAPGDPAPLLALAADSGRAVVFLDLTGVRDKAGFMDRCTSALGLPAWFGRNWDALADSLTDLSWLPAAQGRVLVLGGWTEYAREQPREWTVAREVLAEASEYWRDRATPLTVLLTPA